MYLNGKCSNIIMPALETYGKIFQSYEYLIHMFQFFINRNWSPLRHISENNSVQFKINWPLKASLNRGSEVIGSEHLCIHDNILNFYQSDWMKYSMFDVTGPFLTDIPPHTRHRNLNAWKGVSQGRSSATCVEGGGVVPCPRHNLLLIPGLVAGPASGLRHPHTPHTSWWEDARPRGQSSATSTSSQLSNTLEPSERRSEGEIVDTHCSDSLLMSLLLFFFCGFLGNLENIKSSRA